MKKKIKDLTLEEVANICKKCDDGYVSGCPFYRVLIVDCVRDCTNAERRQRFESEIEVQDE